MGIFPRPNLDDLLSVLKRVQDFSEENKREFCCHSIRMSIGLCSGLAKIFIGFPHILNHMLFDEIIILVTSLFSRSPARIRSTRANNDTWICNSPSIDDIFHLLY